MISPKADRICLEKLRSDTMSKIREAIGSAPREIILLDVPRHRNLGDSLIWQGTLQYLENLGHRVVHQSDLGRHRDSDLKRFSDSAVILLQGGGNMGDLYPEHDLFRQHVIATNPKRRILIMPQSIHYRNSNTMAKAMQIYSLGDDTTVFLREHRSIETADKWSSLIDIRFCHDAALGATLENTTMSADQGLLTLARDDEERANASARTPAFSTDWSYGRMNRLLWKSNIAVGALYKRSPAAIQDISYPYSQTVTLRLLRLNIEAAVTQFSRHSAVATDRLHAHVLAVLLGIPHAVTDNSYGKISSIFNEYTGQFSNAHWATSLDEAVSISHELLNTQSNGER